MEWFWQHFSACRALQIVRALIIRETSRREYFNSEEITTQYAHKCHMHTHINLHIQHTNTYTHMQRTYTYSHISCTSSYLPWTFSHAMHTCAWHSCMPCVQMHTYLYVLCTCTYISMWTHIHSFLLFPVHKKPHKDPPVGIPFARRMSRKWPLVAPDLFPASTQRYHDEEESH